MATKPSTVPTFNTGGANNVAPSSSKRILGWEIGEQPPSTTFNNLQKLYGEWDQYLSDGALRAAHTIQATDATTYTPLLAGLDPATAAHRSNIDHNGFRMGQVSEWVEDWRTSGTTEPTGWAFSFIGLGARLYDVPSVDMPYRHVALSTGAASETLVLKGPYLSYVDANRIIVMEWDCRTGAAVDSGVSMDYEGGLRFSHSAADDYFVQFRIDPDTNANILCQVNGTSLVSNSSSVAIAVSTTYRLRIEIVGDSNHSGSNFLARFFINGTFIRSDTFSSPAADNVRPWHALDNNGGAVDYSLRVGPNRIAWNHRLTPDQL